MFCTLMTTVFRGHLLAGLFISFFPSFSALGGQRPHRSSPPHTAWHQAGSGPGSGKVGHSYPSQEHTDAHTSCLHGVGIHPRFLRPAEPRWQREATPNSGTRRGVPSHQTRRNMGSKQRADSGQEPLSNATRKAPGETGRARERGTKPTGAGLSLLGRGHRGGTPGLPGPQLLFGGTPQEAQIWASFALCSPVSGQGCT